MENNSCYVLNGRTQSDQPAHYTHINSLGENIIDLVWINISALSIVKDFEIIEHSENSDHLFCSVNIILQDLAINKCKSYNRTFTRKDLYSWDDNKSNLYQYFLNSSPSLYFNSDCSDKLFANLEKVIKVASANAGLIETKIESNNKCIKNRDKIWFDSECKEAKNKIKSSHKECKANQYSDESLVALGQTKTNYKRLLKLKEAEYYSSITSKLSRVSNSKEFWSTIKQYRYKNTNKNEISLRLWISHLKKLNPPLPKIETQYFDTFNPELDSSISLGELLTSLKKCKNHKAPGLDSIPGEFIKNLPTPWLHYTLNMFNCIIESEILPSSWRNSKLFMLYKKGDERDPASYRPISLLSSFLKLFTRILTTRLTIWAEKYNVLPEMQCGFRENRGCLDNLFCLTALTQSVLRLKGRYLYAIFIDFRQAFDSVNHTLLWIKLFKAGVSSKFIRLVQNLYEGAAQCISVGAEQSDPITITKGVLQGDSLSCQLFNLFIADFEAFFRARQVTGVSIDDQNDILMLAYADDVVILSDNPRDVQKKLNLLETYCSENKLEVNCNKTKIVIFHKSPKKKKINSFHFKDTTIEIVNSYTYLGIPFSFSAKFQISASNSISKARSAVGSVLQILNKTRCCSWEKINLLFSSIVKSTLCYGAEIWAPNYLEMVETVQTLFFKRLLHLPFNTPGYMVRLETGRSQICVDILKNALSWWEKLLQMPRSRLPRICFDRLVYLDSLPYNNPKYNWFSQINNIIKSIGNRETQQSNPTYIIKYKAEIIEQYQNKMLNEDLRRVSNSSYSLIYKKIYNENSYITENLNINIKRLCGQIRVHKVGNLQLYWRSNKYLLTEENQCQLCNRNAIETPQHFFLECPTYAPFRLKYITKSDLCDVLSPRSDSEVTNLYKYTCQALTLRNFSITI